jgi:hypothetical protein
VTISRALAEARYYLGPHVVLETRRCEPRLLAGHSGAWGPRRWCSTHRTDKCAGGAPSYRIKITRSIAGRPCYYEVVIDGAPSWEVAISALVAKRGGIGYSATNDAAREIHGKG